MALKLNTAILIALNGGTFVLEVLAIFFIYLFFLRGQIIKSELKMQKKICINTDKMITKINEKDEFTRV